MAAIPKGNRIWGVNYIVLRDRDFTDLQYKILIETLITDRKYTVYSRCQSPVWPQGVAVRLVSVTLNPFFNSFIPKINNIKAMAITLSGKENLL